MEVPLENQPRLPSKDPFWFRQNLLLQLATTLYGIDYLGIGSIEQTVNIADLGSRAASYVGTWYVAIDNRWTPKI